MRLAIETSANLDDFGFVDVNANVVPVMWSRSGGCAIRDIEDYELVSEDGDVIHYEYDLSAKQRERVDEAIRDAAASYGDIH